MRRDWEVIRRILLILEEMPSGQWLSSQQLETHGINNEVAVAHMKVLIDAGYVSGSCLSTTCNVERLTWEGHEFLDGIRSDTMWNQVKRAVADRGVELSVDAIKASAKYVLARVFL